MSAEQSKSRARVNRRGWKVTASWSPLTTEAEAAMLPGTRLAVLLSGVGVPVVKVAAGVWRIETRGAVKSTKLHGRAVAVRVPRGGEQ